MMSRDPIGVALEQILAEVAACVRQVPSEDLARAVELMETSPRIFVAGAGRSGLCMRALGMRLMHLGKTVYVVGETTTPSIAAEDLLILGSGSGQTLACWRWPGRHGARALKSCSSRPMQPHRWPNWPIIGW